MDDIGTPTPATEESMANGDRADPAAARPRTTIIGAVLGGVVGLLLIAGAVTYLAGRDTSTEVASRQQPERPPVATAPAPSKSAENPPPAIPASPQPQSATPPPQPSPPQQSAAPRGPRAEAVPRIPPAAAKQQPAPLSDRAAALPGNEDVLFVRAPRANIRSEPGRRGRVIGTAVKGSQVKVIGRAKNWIEVETDTGKGWIGASLLGPQSPGRR